MINDSKLLTIFQIGQNNGVKLWTFDGNPGEFPYKVIPDIDLVMK